MWKISSRLGDGIKAKRIFMNYENNTEKLLKLSLSRVAGYGLNDIAVRNIQNSS